MILNNQNKKGAVELSLSLIVMLVVGLVVLALIINFVTGFFSSVNIPVPGEDDKDKLEQTLNLGGNFEFLEENIEIEKDESLNKLYLKIQNPTENILEFSGGGSPLSDTTILKVDISSGPYVGTPSGIDVFSQPFNIEAGKKDSIVIYVRADGTTKIGQYYLKFSIDGLSDITTTLNVK